MQSFWTPLRVGLVVAAAAVAFGLALYFIGGTIGGDRTYSVYAMFEDATGLGVRSRVHRSRPDPNPARSKAGAS